MSDKALTDYRDVREDQLVRNEARHIRSKINDARGSRHDAGVRWPFELLQNALDAGPRPGCDRVEVRLRQNGDKFVFEHDGAFFTLRDLAALLSGGSSKEFESEDTTGRFGTGFLVTHVLAPRTTVSGIFATGEGLERFALMLDRGGDEESIVANIAACDAAIRSASPLLTTDGVPSASFTYVTDDSATLHLGMASFRSAVPYLFATCERLGRVTFETESGTPETWEAGPMTSRTMDAALVHERPLSCRRDDQGAEYRAVRVAAASSPNQAALAVLLNVEGRWRLQLPAHDFPRVFCRYPIRSSTFLPINAVLDAPFDLDQERRRILLDKEEVKRVFHLSVSAVVPLVRLAYKEGWDDRHWLARAAPSPSSFADKEDEQETDWLTKEMRSLADELVRLPIVATRNGLGASVEGTDGNWFADFVDAHSDGTTMNRLWPLVDDAEDLCPPVAELADAWAAIASGWHDLGVQVNQVGLAVLAKYVRGDAERIEDLSVRCDKREWIARFLDVVGECWAGRGVNADLVERMVPNQSGALVPRKDLKRDDGIPDALKKIADSLGCGVRSRLVDLTILEIAREQSLGHVESVLKSAFPVAMAEDDVLDECVRLLEKQFPKAERLSDSNRALILASIRLLDYLAQKGDAATSLAARVPLLAHDGTFARTSAQRKMISPVETWDERARTFHAAYPLERVLAPEYVGTNIVAALIGWGIAFREPLIKMRPADPIKDDRLRCLAIEGEETEGVQVHGEEFTQIALLHELLPRCQERDEAASLLGLALCYMAPADTSWRNERVVVGRRSGADVPITVRGALWLADLRARAWVPVRSDEGRTSQVMPTPESLKSLLDPAWLRGNVAALEFLGRFFGFDALDLQLLAAHDDESRQELRDRLARIVELAGANPETLVEVEAELQVRKKRAQDVARCRTLGLDVQAAIKLALEAQKLTVKVVDVGYDFDVSCRDLDDAASRLEVGSYFVEVKATTHGDAKLTPKQAETASQRADRYILCVVDLRGIPEERLDEPWSIEDVLSLAHLVPQVGTLVRGTWELVEEARTSEVGLRNENALRYAVRPEVWEEGCSIREWVAAAFKAGVRD
ncbi:sacsin N-terminal ATP-binding-like domain-containing protein [Sorangium sp. So ce887]|uniref:sacsin N-terminal ATP-binding-like domain-containing protein n=1 Tax=Sorangium sp. So ce887 TaxID=3133324 RepID=UPI003F5E2E99